MALGALSLPSVQTSFDAQGTAMVPVTAGGGQTLGKLEIRSPMDTLKDVFFDMKESLSEMVGIQTEEAKRQAFVDKQFLIQKSFENEQANRKLEDAGMQGPVLPTLNNDLEGVDSDTETKAKVTNPLLLILDDLKDSFERVSFGEKMTAILLFGGLALFSRFKDTLVKVLTPVVEFVMNLVDAFGPGAVFATFIGVFLAFKIGLAQFVLKFAGLKLLKGLNLVGSQLVKRLIATNLAIKKSGGYMFSAGKTANKLGKGVTMLGRGLTGLRLSIMSMSSSLAAMLVPFLPAIAIAAAVVAVLYSLKSGFEVFKKSLDDGDSMLVAIGKGIADFALTLYTLPLTLIKNLVGYIAGLLGFDNFKEKLASFSFKDGFINIISGFVDKVKSFFGAIFDFDFSKLGQSIAGIGSTIANIMKALGKGALAFVKAIPKMLFGGEHPTAAFGRVYNEVRAGGEAKEGTDNVNSSTVNTPLETNNKFETNNMMREKTKELEKQSTEKERILRESKSSTPIVVNSTKQGDTINQKSETNVTGELTTDHAEATQKMINNAMA